MLITDMMVICGANGNENIRLGRARPRLEKINTFINQFGTNLPLHQNFQWALGTNEQLCQKWWCTFGANGGQSEDFHTQFQKKYSIGNAI